MLFPWFAWSFPSPVGSWLRCGAPPFATARARLQIRRAEELMVLGPSKTTARLGPLFGFGLKLPFVCTMGSPVCLVHDKFWCLLDKCPGIEHMALHGPHHLELLLIVIN